MREFKPKSLRTTIENEIRNRHGLTDEQHKAMLAEFSRRLLQFAKSWLRCRDKRCRRQMIDESVNMREVHRFIGDAILLSDALDETVKRISARKLESTGRKVAIVGAGPAGLRQLLPGVQRRAHRACQRRLCAERRQGDMIAERTPLLSQF